jgi:hypothetical protein
MSGVRLWVQLPVQERKERNDKGARKDGGRDRKERKEGRKRRFYK